MLITISVALTIAFFGYHKKKGTWLYWLGGCLFISVGIVAVFLGGWLSIKTTAATNLKILEYREENAVMKEKRYTLKREFIENGILDDDSLEKFIKEYLELNNQILNADENIEELEKELKSKEKFDFLLFFNLF